MFDPYTKMDGRGKEIIRKNIVLLIEGLDAKSIVNHLFAGEVINGDLVEKIKACTTLKEANDVLVWHLHKSASMKTLDKFYNILKGTSEICSRHSELLEKLVDWSPNEGW